MSSPPYNPTSPVPLSKKRPSFAGSVPNPKRRKASIASASSHPLRQTSFPPDEQQLSAVTSPRTASFSPPFDGNASVANSAVSSSGGPGKRKRGRKSKAGAKNNAAGSVIGGPATSPTADGQGSLINTRVDDDEDIDDDEGDIGDDTMLDGIEKMDEAEQHKENQHLAMLLSALNEEQRNRYEVWRRVRLKKETVRKITNQTLSQSVPASIVIAINGYTKVFIGELIERARDVQIEWLAASRILRNNEPKDFVKGSVQHGINAEPETPDESENVDNAQSTLKNVVENPYDVEDRDLGPLTPDHLREALRRYKKERVGGSAGFQGLSLHGRENVAARSGGRRLFR